MKMIYVAGKYSGKTYSEGDDNIKKAEEVSIEDIEHSVAPWKCKYCDYTNTVGTDICLNCNTNINEGDSI